MFECEFWVRALEPSYVATSGHAELVGVWHARSVLSTFSLSTSVGTCARFFVCSGSGPVRNGSFVVEPCFCTFPQRRHDCADNESVRDMGAVPLEMRVVFWISLKHLAVGHQRRNGCTDRSNE